MVIRLMNYDDLVGAAEVHQLAFPRQNHSLEWLQSNLNATPRFLNFVAVDKEQIIGYITWVQKSGFRPETVLELEQIAVKPDYQGKGIGRHLIKESLPVVRNHLAKKGAILKHILVTTRADNYAQKLYKNTLGAEVETTIPNLYSADEVIMVARNLGE